VSIVKYNRKLQPGHANLYFMSLHAAFQNKQTLRETLALEIIGMSWYVKHMCQIILKLVISRDCYSPAMATLYSMSSCAAFT